MDTVVVMVIYLVLLLLLIFSGMPIVFALGGLGILSIFIWISPVMLEQIPYLVYNAAAEFTITAIPLYILLGSLFTHTGLASMVYSALSPLLCRILPGGLLQVNIFAGTIFAAASGSSTASTSIIGLLALPEMESRGYDRKLSCGSIAAGGSLGVLIPPSITLIIYGAMTTVSVGQLFIAGILPGLLLSALYMSYVATRVLKNPALVPPKENIPLKTCFVKSLSAWPMLFIIFAVLVSIYMGIATPSEAAALGVVAILILAVALRKLTWGAIKKSTWEAIALGSMLLLLFAVARVMTVGIALLHIPDALFGFITMLGIGQYGFLIIFVIVFTLAGMVMEGLALVVLVIPLVYPILVAFGFDPVWSGILIVLLGQGALISPPVGLNLFVIQGLRPNYPYSHIMAGAAPFLLMIGLALLVITIFPDLATWLPQTMIMQ